MFKQLKETINRKNALVIQTHDNPDHDAIATAYALQQLLIKFSLPSTICYGGSIQSAALIGAIEKLKITLHHVYNTTITDNAQIIYVDGCKESNNIAHTKGKGIAIIDHHVASLLFEANYPFADIRADYGSCSSILAGYYQEAGLPPMPSVATALMMGIMMDTAYLTRAVNTNELKAIQFLYPKADWHNGSKLLRNSLTISDIAIFNEACDNNSIDNNFCFIRLRREATPDTIGLLADFFLNIREIDFVVVIHPQGEYYKISVRSESDELSAHEILQSVIHGIGSGGGHAHMAGGVVPKKYQTHVANFQEKFLARIRANSPI